MTSFITLPWTCLRGVATKLNAFARTIRVLIAQGVPDIEHGISEQKHASQPEHLANGFQPEVLAAMWRTISIFSQSMYRLTRLKNPEVDVEKSISDSDATSNSSTVMGSRNASSIQALSTSDDASSSQSLSISSVLDLFPIPMTTPQEHSLVASILAMRQGTPSPPATPSLMSPRSDSSRDSSFAPGTEEPDMPNTPVIRKESVMSCSIQTSPPDLLFGQQTQCLGIENDAPKPVGRPDTWTGDPGFRLPNKPGISRKAVRFVPSCSIVEEEKCLSEDESYQNQKAAVTSGSPWDEGINEAFGLKGRVFWKQAMKIAEFKDERLWIN